MAGQCAGDAANRGRHLEIWPDLVRNSTARWYRLSEPSPALKIVTGPQVSPATTTIVVKVNGSPAPGVSSGTALAPMTIFPMPTLRQATSFEWTGTAYQEHEATGQNGTVLRSRLFDY